MTTELLESADDLERLPNRAREAIVLDDQSGTPEHILAIQDPNHDGVCGECGFYISIGSDGTEYGHAHAQNRSPASPSGRVACSHRPSGVNPGGEKR